MNTNQTTLLVLLLAVVAFAAYLKISNPHKRYSQQAFWETATVDDVQTIPAGALRPGNRNGSVLMWAATTTKDPAVLEALVARGADVNEMDWKPFEGTPLSGAAAMTTEPVIIDTLIDLGAEVNTSLGSWEKTALIIAAELNHNPAIIERLVVRGADVTMQDHKGQTALDQARLFKNEGAIGVLAPLMEQQPPAAAADGA